MSTAELTAPAIPKIFDEKKSYRVRLSRNWKQPRFKGDVPPSGIIYQRGEGKFQWKATDGEDVLTISGADLNEFCLLPENQRFERDGVKYRLDPHLIAEEIK